MKEVQPGSIVKGEELEMKSVNVVVGLFWLYLISLGNGRGVGGTVRPLLQSEGCRLCWLRVKVILMDRKHLLGQVVYTCGRNVRVGL